jgi:hypothetical protein
VNSGSGKSGFAAENSTSRVCAAES